jgi:hypothetical protein
MPIAAIMMRGTQMTRDMLGNVRLAGLVFGAFLGAVNLAYIDEAVAFEGDGFSSARAWSPRAVGVGEWSVLVPMATGDQPEDGLELAIRMVKREVASRSPELVTVSRTLAGDQFEERIRTLSAAFVTGAVVAQKERMIAGRPYLEVVVKAVVEQISAERIAEALASDRVRATRLRFLEGEVARLEAVLLGIPPDEKQEEVDRARRRAALDALLASETEIRQTFLADGLTGQKLRAGRRFEAAAEVFERDIVLSALSTEADARIEHASFATEEESREFRRRDWATGREPVVALTKVFWALPNELEHYSRILARWFRVMGATVMPDYVVVPGGQARGSQGICVGANDGRKEFPEAAELFEYMKGRSINLQVEVALDRETEGREERKGFDVQIAGVFNGGTHWCLFDSPREAAALPFRSQPGVYAFSRGAALSAENPYRLLMSEEESKAVSHVSVSVVDQGMPREK